MNSIYAVLFIYSLELTAVKTLPLRSSNRRLRLSRLPQFAQHDMFGNRNMQSNYYITNYKLSKNAEDNYNLSENARGHSNSNQINIKPRFLASKLKFLPSLSSLSNRIKSGVFSNGLKKNADTTQCVHGQIPVVENGGCCSSKGYVRGVDCSGNGICVVDHHRKESQSRKNPPSLSNRIQSGLSKGFSMLKKNASSIMKGIKTLVTGESSEVHDEYATSHTIHSYQLSKEEQKQSLGHSYQHFFDAVNPKPKTELISQMPSCGEVNVCAKCDCREGWMGDICEQRVPDEQPCSPLDPSCETRHIPQPMPCIGKAEDFSFDDPCRSMLAFRIPSFPKKAKPIPNFIPLRELDRNVVLPYSGE